MSFLTRVDLDKVANLHRERRCNQDRIGRDMRAAAAAGPLRLICQPLLRLGHANTAAVAASYRCRRRHRFARRGRPGDASVSAGLRGNGSA
jgi:hypothetical protein